MKNLVLNQINLEIIHPLMMWSCDYCGTNDNKTPGIKSEHPFKYWSGYDKKEDPERHYYSVICFNCIKQLAKLIEK